LFDLKGCARLSMKLMLVMFSDKLDANESRWQRRRLSNHLVVT